MRMRGFTLLELLVVLALLGVVFLFLPGTLQASVYRHRAAVSETRAFLQGARTEAIRRGTMVAVVQPHGQENRLLACLDTNHNSDCDLNEAPLRTLILQSSTLELRSGFHPGLRFNALGQLNTGARLVVRTAGHATALCLSLAGRVRESPGGQC
ncbi:GspH/FimT family protein [Thermus sp. NMX2.A1]|uniref:GspH/FimT family protein n=1 Tax=Thermus sp. NMX2.A1 TaxID=570924 RepID=UPI0003FAB719|nr:GspH/FimT family protein [Thermus sp. NMX2.A1]